MQILKCLLLRSNILPDYLFHIKLICFICFKLKFCLNISVAGVRLNVDFKAPTWAPEYHQNIVVTVTYELYDGIPLLAKWVSVKAYPPAVNEVKVAFISVEYLALNQPWVQSPNCPNAGNGWMFVETDQPHATEVQYAHFIPTPVD